MQIKRAANLLIFLTAFILLAGIGNATVLDMIRYRSYPERLRVVFDLQGKVDYQVTTSEGFIEITLPNTSADRKIKNVTELENEIINYIGCERLSDALKIGIFFRFNTPYKIFFLPSPSRLIIDCNRDFIDKTNNKTIAPGLEYFEVVQGLSQGHTRAHVLKIDQDKIIAKPALAFPESIDSSLLESIGDFFGNLLEEEVEHNLPSFARSKVSNIAKKHKALAAVNGTYFASNGQPLGILMIDQELITLPPYERTALALTSDHRAYIDNFLASTYFSLKDNSFYEITKINEPRESSDAILYTPRYGAKTETNPGGIELTCRKGEIVNIGLKNSRIPADGFVISAKGALLENLGEKARIGDPLTLHLSLIPFSFKTQADILQLIGGGPRLVKRGQAYVSKYMERFKKDIALGRAARTAVGITKDNQLILATIDGRLRGEAKKALLPGEEESLGMNLEEVSNLMLYLGAVEAMNLDGGSSSSMVIEDKVVNRPVTGKEEKVSNAIILLLR